MTDSPTPGYYSHPTALVESTRIGAGTRVWAFAHILPGATIGVDCNICDGVFIENDVVVGDRVTIKCGVQLWDGVRLEDDVFVGPNATFTNDAFPRSRQHLEVPTPTIVRAGASIGANATILPGLVVGRDAMVGAGSVVTRSVPPHSIVVGNPAEIRGYTNLHPGREDSAQEGHSPLAERHCSVNGVGIHELPVIHDMRGDLSVAEMGKGLPFLPRRCFVVFDVPSREVRGAHAHRTLHQFLVCVAGDCHLVVDDGRNREDLHLCGPGMGVHLRPMVWGTQYGFSRDAVLLVLASRPYDADDYIRDYDEFLRLVGAVRG